MRTLHVDGDVHRRVPAPARIRDVDVRPVDPVVLARPRLRPARAAVGIDHALTTATAAASPRRRSPRAAVRPSVGSVATSTTTGSSSSAIAATHSTATKPRSLRAHVVAHGAALLRASNVMRHAGTSAEPRPQTAFRRRQPSSSPRAGTIDADVVAQGTAQQPVEHFLARASHTSPVGHRRRRRRARRHRGVAHSSAGVEVDEQVRDEHEEHERQRDRSHVLDGREARSSRRASPDELAADPVDDVDAERCSSPQITTSASTPSAALPSSSAVVSPSSSVDGTCRFRIAP